ncbi:MAG: hypothetical protein ABH860_05230, partial [bacterium]
MINIFKRLTLHHWPIIIGLIITGAGVWWTHWYQNLDYELKLSPVLNIIFDDEKQMFEFKNDGSIKIIDIDINSI